MSNIIDKAKEYLSYQLGVIPTTEDKFPALDSWKDLQNKILSNEEIDTLFNGGVIRPEIEREVTKKDNTKVIVKGIKSFIKPVGIGIITGAISGNLEVIDVDTKYDITGSLWEDLKTLLEDNLPEIYNSLVIATTKNGGYHIYYKCISISGALKLANREPTPEERKETYNLEISKGATEVEAKNRSEKEKEKVLIETRGEAGYVIAYPSKGYNFIQGDPKNIPTITPEDREILFSISKSFNSIPEKEPVKVSNNISNIKYDNLSPFEDYNNRGDVIELLQSNGWRVINERGQRINLLRPGQTDSKTSGNYHTGLKVLRVFSSSTEFNPDKGYSPAMVFSLLECNEDNKLAYRKLLDLGYGEPLSGEIIKPTTMTTERIKVSSVNSINRETSVISNPGESLKTENIQTAVGEDVVITSPGSEAQEEVLKAIDLIQETGKRIYINEGDYTIREYRYQISYIFGKYAVIEEAQGGLTDKDKFNFLDEIVITAHKLQPIDKDIFLKYFLDQDSVKELGITEESLGITVDRLTSTRDKEAQAIDFDKLLTEVNKLKAKGEVNKALDLIESTVKEVKLKDKATEFSKLLSYTTEQQIKEEEANLPDSLSSGFFINGEELLLPGGAISVYAAPTNHGKTIMLINTVLNVAIDNPDKKYIFLTYEERANSIIQYFLNAYVNLDLNSSGGGNRRIIKDYFKTGSTQYIAHENLEYFKAKKEEFFKMFIETGRIIVKYIDYDSNELTTAIEYLHKETNIGGVFIDYFQLLKLPQGKYKNYGSRQEELKQICIALKDVAVSTGLPIILAAQFNREVTNLMRLHPTNIGEAGDIERIVNTLIGLWNMHKKPMLKGITDAEADQINYRVAGKEKAMYVEILKSRDLPTGSYELLDFNGNTGKISNQANAFFSNFSE